MERIRKTQATLNLSTLKHEGRLCLPDQLGKANQDRASAPLAADYGTLKGEYSLPSRSPALSGPCRYASYLRYHCTQLNGTSNPETRSGE